MPQKIRAGAIAGGGARFRRMSRKSNLKDVERYIASQEEHHRRMSFQEELIAMLQKRGVEWDERYLWD